jgi:hypothetical protein
MRCPPHANALPTLQARRLYVGGVRFYEVGNTLYPAVTTILSVVARPNLVAWARRTALEAIRQLLETATCLEELRLALDEAAQEPERVRDEARERGTAVHQAIALALEGEPYPSEWEPWVRAALGFLEDHGLRLLASEQVLVSRRHGYAGTCDVASLQEDGGLVLLDWKTGGVYSEHALQLGAYAIALEEMTGREVRGAYVVGLRQGSYEARRVDLPVAQQGFLAALTLWRALRGELYG